MGSRTERRSNYYGSSCHAQGNFFFRSCDAPLTNLQGTVSSTKHEILFSRFGINYNEISQRFKKGSVIVREIVRPNWKVLFRPLLTTTCRQALTHRTRANGKNPPCFWIAQRSSKNAMGVPSGQQCLIHRHAYNIHNVRMKEIIRPLLTLLVKNAPRSRRTSSWQ